MYVMNNDMRKWINLTESEIFKIDSYDLIDQLVELLDSSDNWRSKQKAKKIIDELERRGEPWEEMMPEGDDWRART